MHCAIAVSTAVLGSHRDNVRCTAVEEQPEAKEVCRYGKSAIICSAGIPNKEATLPVRSKTQALAFCIVKNIFYTGLFITGFTTKYMAIP